MPDSQRGKDDSESWGKVLGYGAQTAVGATVGWLVGSWLDRKFGWAPWGMTVGIMLGVASGMYLLIKDAIRMNRD